GTYIDTADKNLNVYGPKDKDIIKQVKNTKINKFHAYDKDSAIKVGPFTVTFHKNTHPVETYAIKITDDEGRELVYTADTSYRKSLVKLAEDADALITECSHYDDVDAERLGHMNADEVALLADKSGAKQVLLAHLPHDGDVEELLQTMKYAGKEHAVLA